MNFKRIMLLVLVLTMIVSACAPAIQAFDGVLGSHEHNHAESNTKKEEINYVSLGDSVANGVGLKDYVQNHPDFAFQDWASLPQDSFPAKFAAWLSGDDDGYNSVESNKFTYKGESTVHLTQLAMNSIRVEDILYLLQLGKEVNQDINYELDMTAEAANHPWIYNEFVANNMVEGDIVELWVPYVASVFYTSVLSADIITLTAGSVNFGEYLVKVLLETVEGDTSYDYMTVESAIELCFERENVKAKVNELYANAKETFATMGATGELLEKLAGRVAYVVASFLVSYENLLDYIVEINPDIEVVLVPMVNTVEDLSFELEIDGTNYSAEIKPYFEYVCAAINVHIAGYPALEWGSEKDYYDYSYYVNKETGEKKTELSFEEKLYEELFANYPEMQKWEYVELREPKDVPTFYYAKLDGEVEMLTKTEFNTDHETLMAEYAKFMGVKVEELGFTKAEAEAFEKIYADNSTDSWIEYLFAGNMSYDEKVSKIVVYMTFVDVLKEAAKTTHFDLTSCLSFGDFVLDPDSLLEGNVQEQSKLYEDAEGDFLNSAAEYLYQNKKDVFASVSDAKKFIENDGNLNVGVQLIARAWVMKNIVKSNIENNEAIMQLLGFYGRAMVFNGITTSPSAAGHEAIADAVINAYETGYTAKDETIKNIKIGLLVAAGLVAEYYDEAYAEGYKYLDENGYIDVAIESLDKAIEALYAAIAEVEGGFLGATDEFVTEVVKELYATIDTLKELREVLASGNAADADGFIDAVIALQDDLNTHLSNIYAILRQAGVDVNQLAILPVLNEALRILNEEVIPVVRTTVDTFVKQVVEFCTAVYDTIYPIYSEVSAQVRKVIEVLIIIGIYANEAYELAVDTYTTIVEKMLEIYGSVTIALEKATEIYTGIVSTLLDINANIKETIEFVVNTYNTILDVALDVYSDVKYAIELANKIFHEVAPIVVKAVNTAIDVYEVLREIYIKVVDILVEAGLDLQQATEFAMKLIGAIAEQIIGTIDSVEDAIAFAEKVFTLIVETTKFIYENANAIIEDITVVIKIAAEIYTTLVKIAIATGITPEEALQFAIDAFEFIVKAVKFAVENYDVVVDCVEFAIRVYTEIVKFIVENEEEIEKALEIAKKAFEAIVDVLGFVYENREEIYETTVKIYEIATKVYVALVEVIINVHGAFETAKDVYNYLVDIFTVILGDVEEAIRFVEMIYGRVVELMIQAGNDVNSLINRGQLLYNEVLNMLNTAYGQTIAAIETAERVYLACIEMLVVARETINEMIYDSSNGSYELTDDSLYVALGEDTFAEELAAKLNLSNKYFRFGLEENYLDMVAKADLVTVKLDNGSYGEFAYAQVHGVVAEILRSHEDFMTFYNHALIGSFVKEGLDTLHIDINAQAVELEWNKYLDEEGREMLDTVLAQFKAELLRAGVPEYYYIELQSYADQILEDYGIAGLGVALDIDPVVIPVVDLTVYALENVLYAYARFTSDMTSIISNVHAVSPDATVVFMGVTNPLEGFELDLSTCGVDFVDYSECVMAADVLVEMLNVQIYGAALVSENVIFVHDNDADAIYNALHVYCDHVYDDCLDAECNRCLAIRVVLGHSFTKYVSNNDATCTEDGTETAKCDYCDAVDTRTDSRSALGHDWKAATCTRAFGRS